MSPCDDERIGDVNRFPVINVANWTLREDIKCSGNIQSTNRLIITSAHPAAT